jgi:hypothetical protein
MTEAGGGNGSGGRKPEEAAAKKAGDEDRLMRGENPETAYVEDAEHWTGVYRQLLDFKRDLLEFTKNRIATMEEAASDELATTDLVLMEAEHQRLRSRLDFWEQRRRDLSGGSAGG